MTLPTSLSPIADLLAGYPEWLVVACATVVVAALLWILAKVLKWSLYLLAIFVLVAGLVATVVLFFEASAPDQSRKTPPVESRDSPYR